MFASTAPAAAFTAARAKASGEASGGSAPKWRPSAVVAEVAEVAALAAGAPLEGGAAAAKGAEGAEAEGVEELKARLIADAAEFGRVQVGARADEGLVWGAARFWCVDDGGVGCALWSAACLVRTTGAEGRSRPPRATDGRRSAN